MAAVKFTFEELKVYNKALDFIDMVYTISNDFPNDEKFRITSQFIRGATSIALNIAEGSGDTNLQFNRFLQIALNSVKECVVCARIARRQNFISIELENELREKLEELSKMITGLQKYLKTKTKD